MIHLLLSQNEKYKPFDMRALLRREFSLSVPHSLTLWIFTPKSSIYLSLDFLLLNLKNSFFFFHFIFTPKFLRLCIINNVLDTVSDDHHDRLMLFSDVQPFFFCMRRLLLLSLLSFCNLTWNLVKCMDFRKILNCRMEKRFVFLFR